MPKLKGGEMKVPPFLSDLYFDLRERRLLPLVALILIAIVATPILLAGGSDKPEPPPAPSSLGDAGSTPTAKTLNVVQAEPGLRNYKKRLAHRHPTNPFKQRFDQPRTAGGQLNEATTSTESTATTETASGSESETVVTSPSGSRSGGSSPGGGNGSGGGNQELPPGMTIFTFAIDVEVTKIEPQPDGSVTKTGPALHKEVLPPTPLPGEKAPAAAYLGMGAKTELPLFLVSPEVTAVFGEAKCVAGTGSCQLLAVEPNMPEVFEYGPNHVRYKIKVLKVKPVVTGKS
jgi:hypothetical protein